MKLRGFLAQPFLVRLELDSLLLKLLLDIHDFLFFARELAADFHDLALQLLFELDDALLSPLEVGCLLSHLAFKRVDLLH